MPPLPPTPLLSRNHTSNALELLFNAREKQIQELNKYPSDPQVEDCDLENDSAAPIYESFFQNGGDETVRNMTNFTSRELQTIWNRLENYIKRNWDIGRGRRCGYAPKDVLFMTLTTMKHGGQWEFLAHMFRIKATTFERMITKFILCLADHVLEQFVFSYEEKYTISRVSTDRKLFKYYGYARYATDVFFHHANRPSGNLQEGKVYYSGKHKLYGFKTEISVLANGTAIGCSYHYPGSKSDIDIFSENIEFHETALEKRDDEKNIPDTGELLSKYKNLWAVLADKGYQGGEHFVRLIHPKKKPQHRLLSPEESLRNRNISSDRIIVENWLGRFCSLWSLFSTKYRWAEKNYEAFFDTALSFTNVHLRWNPLRADDLDFYRRYINRLYHIGASMIEKRRTIQKKYRDNKRRRLSQEFNQERFSDEATLPP